MSDRAYPPTTSTRPTPAQRPRSTRLLVAALMAGTVSACLLWPAPATASISVINSDRGGAGLGPLAENGGLDGLASRHAREMAGSNTLSHTNDLGGAISSVVPGWTNVGENVGVGSSFGQVNSLFMGSSEHRGNIMGDFTVAGLGVATGSDGRVWVAEEFARTSAAGSPAPARPSAPAHASRPQVASEPVPSPVAAPPAPATSVVPVLAATATALGYRLIGSDGGVFAFGGAPFAGSAATEPLQRPVVASAAPPVRLGRRVAAPDGIQVRQPTGYWLASADGGVFAYGDAAYLGGPTGRPLNSPIVGMAATPTGGGYWLVAADGGVFAYGSADYLGGAAGRPLNSPIVGMAATPTGAGYWLVAADGGLFAYGDAPYLGGPTGQALNSPIVGMAATPTGAGYWLVAADGGVFAYGDAAYAGGLAGRPLNGRIVAVTAGATSQGYRLIGSDGGVFAFGDASFDGAASAAGPLHAWAPPA